MTSPQVPLQPPRRLYRLTQAIDGRQDYIHLDAIEDVNEGDLLRVIPTGETIEVLRVLKGGAGVRRQYGFARSSPAHAGAEVIRGEAGSMPSYSDVAAAAAEKGIIVGY